MAEINKDCISIKNKRIFIANGLYYLAIILLTIKTVLTSSELISLNETIDKIIFASCTIFIMIKAFTSFESLKQLSIIIGIGIICIYTSIKTKTYHIFTSYLIIVGSYNVSKKLMIKCISYTSTIVISIHVVIYFINLLYGYVTVSEVVKQGVLVPAHTFYLGHSNTVSMYILWILLAFIYLNYEKLSLKTMAIYLFIMVSTYYFTKSRTVLILSIIAIIMIFFDKYILYKNNKLFKYGAKYGFIVLSILSCMLCIFYDKIPNINIIDRIFSGRLLLSSFAYNTYGPTLIGQFIDFSKDYSLVSNWRVSRLALDIMPIRLLINYGIFYLLLLSIMILKSNKYTSKIENILIILMILNSSMEIFTLNGVICFPMVIIGWYMINNKLLYR